MASEPPPRLTADEVAHVARLARLELGEDEIDRYLVQLSALLDHVEAIRRLELSNLAPTAHPLSLVNVLRDDVVQPSLPRDEVLSAAPAAESGCFLVPRILGEAP